MRLPIRVSFFFILIILVLTGWLNLGLLLLSILFSYLALDKLSLLTKKKRLPAVTIFGVILAGIAYGLATFIQQTAIVLPHIAEKAAPAVMQWAHAHHINLPFTDFTSLKEEVIRTAGTRANDLGQFADFARGATKQFIYFIVGCVVAMGLFLNPKLEMDAPPKEQQDNLYTRSCQEIERRFHNFYESFALVIGAQVIISAIDATLTGIFMGVLRLPHLVIAVGVTFLCGLLPVVGNLLSNTVVMAIGFTVSPEKGLLALGFLVCIHQLEYFLNSKIIGGRIHTSLWLTLLGLVLGDSLMGITGIILAPAILHYIRKEATRVHLHPTS